MNEFASEHRNRIAGLISFASPTRCIGNLIDHTLSTFGLPKLVVHRRIEVPRTQRVDANIVRAHSSASVRVNDTKRAFVAP